MLKDTTVRARLDSGLKHDAEAVLKRLGVSMSDAIVMFLAQVRMRKGLPFDVVVPNEETLEAIREARAGKGVKEYDSVDAFFEGLEGGAKRVKGLRKE